MGLLINNIYEKHFEMVEQMERTRNTKSGKNCAIQGVRLIWKQKIWLVIVSFSDHWPIWMLGLFPLFALH